MKLYDPFLWIAKKTGYTPPIPATHWQENVVKFACTKVPEKQVVLLGDSITEGWNSIYLMTNRALNYGIAGDVTAGVLKFIEHILRVNPKRVIVNIGINDINSSIPTEDTFSNYRILLEKLSTVLFKDDIIVCAIRPVSIKHDSNTQCKNIKIQQYNDLIKDLCTNNGYTFEPGTYDCHKLGYNGGYFLNPENSTDGLHLSPAGYLREFEVLKKYL